MIRVLPAAVVRDLDAATITGLGLPGHTLMELAGRAAATELRARWPGARVAVLCGPGNNGGDGYVLARWLGLWGHEVRLWASGAARGDDAVRNAALCNAQGLRPCRGFGEALDGAEVVVDALLGTGQRSAPRGGVAEAVRRLGEARAGGAAVVALDLPTGLDADTGQVLDPTGELVVEADLTVTFGFAKPAFWAMPGTALAGEVEVVDIGLDLGFLQEPQLAEAGHRLLEAPDIDGWRRGRREAEAKWDRGHVAVLGRRGAAVLAAHGAFAAGCGLVSLLLPPAEQLRLPGLRPEVILGEEDQLDPARHDVVVVGPALGADQRDRVLELWREHPGPLVADADALTALAAAPAPAPPGRARVLTPHSAEAARLLGCSRAEVEADRFGAARRLSDAYACTVVLKGPGTLLAAPGEPLRINPRGSAALATAGTGDVLAGLLGGHLALGLGPLEAACVAAWEHGAAGETLPPRGTASDLLGALQAR